jgi:hypothetical protein
MEIHMKSRFRNVSQEYWQSGRRIFRKSVDFKTRLAVGRIGMMWILDIAHLQKGYRLLCCPKAIGYHRDYSLKDLKTSCLRVERASRSAAKLFQRYPELYNHLPMFHDKSPISIRKDPPALVFQKIGHALTAWKPVLSTLEYAVDFLEKNAPWPALLIPLYRWINSSYIFKGYRMGIKDIRSSKVYERTTV